MFKPLLVFPNWFPFHVTKLINFIPYPYNFGIGKIFSQEQVNKVTISGNRISSQVIHPSLSKNFLSKRNEFHFNHINTYVREMHHGAYFFKFIQK